MAIILKNRAADATAPTTGDLVEGEVAINFTSQKIYTRDDSNTILELGAHYQLNAGTGVTISGTRYVDTEPTISITTASTTEAGAVELATQAEVDAGTDTARAITPATLENKPIDAASVDGKSISVLTQAAYDALTPDANTLYFITS